MCGIAGIIAPLEKGQMLKLTQTVTDKMAHRGPDAGQYFAENGIGLGHRRLSIIDLSTSANQPFFDHSGRYVMVFNGEIYNFQEIKNQITDYPFKTSSDTEVLLAGYLKWGEAVLHKLNGFFAIAIWDKVERTLFVARDRMGVKPFYYFHEGETFIFASEIRPILASGMLPRKISPHGFQDYLGYQSVNAPYTMIENLWQLMPGECGIIKNGKFNKKLYWQIEKNYAADMDFSSYGVVKQNIKQLFMDSVERRLISDVPLGAFLSGGIDSSAVVAAMAQFSEQPVNTFSVVFNESHYDESEYSSLIAKKYATKHHKILLKPQNFLEELPAALSAMDSPSGDGINSYIVSKKTREAGVTVALSGLGGDELFAGYAGYQTWEKLQKNRWFWSIPNLLRKPVGNVAEWYIGDSRAKRFNNIISAKSADLVDVFPAYRQIFETQGLQKLLKKGTPQYPNLIQQILAERSADIQKLPYLSQLSVGEILSYTLNVLLKDTDQMSMASALEVREPFFDYKLIEYVMQVPDKFKSPKYAKSLFVESIAPLLPDEVVHRRKYGFTLPWDHWMRNELKDFCAQKLNQIKDRNLLNPDTVSKLWSDYQNRDKKAMPWMTLWYLVSLEDWLEKNEVS
ncbi:MAG: hypothetical protein RL757_574 [Bacteroidota bacterium]|jgi:asparagine synthase (glutamine-hydrolysing)